MIEKINFIIFFLLSLILISSSASAQTSFNAGGINGGAIVVGTSSNTCNGTMLGGIRWSATNSCMEICNGTLWNCIQLSPFGNTLPISFTFTNQSNVAVSTLVTSNQFLSKINTLSNRHIRLFRLITFRYFVLSQFKNVLQ